MYDITAGNPKFDNDYFIYIYEYLSNNSLSKILRTLVAFDDSCITDYDIFKSVADFACKNIVVDRIVVRSGGRYSSLEYHNREFTFDHKLYHYMMQNWTYDLNKYIMSKFNGNWFYIPENKYTLVR
jgi:hypothetical protein